MVVAAAIFSLSLFFFFPTFSSLYGQESSSLTFILLNHIGNVRHYSRQRAIASSKPIDFLTLYSDFCIDRNHLCHPALLTLF